MANSYKKYKLHGLTPMTKAAEAVQMSQQKLWRMIRWENILPEPKTKVGRRYFYNEQQLEELKDKVDDLRNQGVL